MTLLDKRLNCYLESLKKQNLYRKCRLKKNQNVIDFGSNDYLGVTSEVIIQEAFVKAFQTLPQGSGGSMVLSGYHAAHAVLVAEFSSFLGADDGLLFSSGYAANLSVMALLQLLGIETIADREVHASIYDGARAAGLILKRFSSLSRLESLNLSNAVLLTEGIFSQFGRMGDLVTLSPLLYRYGGRLIVDESHSFGILGSEGRGAVSAAALSQKEVPLRVIGFGKAMGCQGAIVVGDKRWIAALLQVARSNRYSTAMSPALAGGLLKTLQYVREASDRRNALWENIAYFRELSKSYPFSFIASDTAIQFLRLGTPLRALNYEGFLLESGIVAHAFRPPTVSYTHSGLRMVLTARHTQADIDRLFMRLSQIDKH